MKYCWLSRFLQSKFPSLAKYSPLDQKPYVQLIGLHLKNQIRLFDNFNLTGADDEQSK